MEVTFVPAHSHEYVAGGVEEKRQEGIGEFINISRVGMNHIQETGKPFELDLLDQDDE